MDLHTQRMNDRYGLDEPFWPCYFGMDTDFLLATFCYRSTLRLWEWDGMTAERVHMHERDLFAMFDEIERRGLVEMPAKAVRSDGERRKGGVVYPWEYDARSTPLTLYDLCGPQSSAAGWGYSPGRARKIGGFFGQDEENMGLYRREKESE
jgi:hypothetical protein